MAVRDSALYARKHTNLYLTVDSRDGLGKVQPIPFSHTVVSGELGGASAGVSDEVNLCVLPANCMVIALLFSANDVWASAGVNGTLSIGDSGDIDRYMVATELYTAAGGPIATALLQNNVLAFAGQNYKPTADTIVLAQYAVANPVVGKVFRGCFLIVPGA